MIDLKPCPFCGSVKVELVNKTRYVMNEYAGQDWYVLCDACCSSTGFYISDHDAVNAWNRRDGDQEWKKCGGPQI